MTHVYLQYENAAGSGDGVQLYPGKSYFLPDDAPSTQGIDVVEEMDGSHSVIKLDIYAQDVLLSAYGSSQTEVLEAPGGAGRYRVPSSTSIKEKLIFMVLRKGDQILTPSGRWSLVWRTGESQMSVPTRALHLNRARLFNVSPEVEDSESQDNDGSIPHDAVDNYIIPGDVMEDGTHAPATILMPPPPLPRVDIFLKTSGSIGDPNDSKESATKGNEDKLPEQVMQDHPALASKKLSQDTRAALSELSSKNLIILRTNSSDPPQIPSILNTGNLHDGNRNLLHPDAAMTKLKAQIHDINARRIWQGTDGVNKENIAPSQNEIEESKNILSRSDDGVVQESIIRTINIETSVEVEHTDSTEPTEDSRADSTIGVVRKDFEALVATSPIHKNDVEGLSRASNASGMVDAFFVGAELLPENQHPFVSPEISAKNTNYVPDGASIGTPDTSIILPSSGSSRKRKTPTYSRKDRFHSKQRKPNFEELRPDHEEEAGAVEIIPKRSETISTTEEKQSPEPERAVRTPKSTAKSALPLSFTNSTRLRNGRKSFKVARDTTPSRSRSSSIAGSTRFAEYLGSPPRVIFTSTTTVDDKKNTMKDFLRLGGKKVESIEKANMLIVGGTGLRKTAKLIIAVARGMDVVNERWIVESRRKGVLVDIIPFLPEDKEQEALWGTTLADAIARAKEGAVQGLLQDTTVHTTKDLDRGAVSRDLPSIVKALGGNIIKGSLPSAKSRTTKVLILGTRQDPQALEAQRMGHKLFDKDLIILGALRGNIDTKSSEYEIEVPVKEEDSQ